MDESPVTFANPLPHAMRSGVSAGLLFAANFLLSTSDNSFLQAITYVVIVMIAVYTWRAATNFRDKESDGAITFYRAFSYVFLLFFFASLISAIVKLIYLKYIDTEYLSKLLSSSMKLIEQLNLTMPEGGDEALQSFLTPINFVMNTVMADMLLGMVLGLVYAPFLKKSPSTN